MQARPAGYPRTPPSYSKALYGSSGRFWAVLGDSGRFWAVLGGSGRFWAVLGGSGRFVPPLTEMLNRIGQQTGPGLLVQLHNHFLPGERGR